MSKYKLIIEYYEKGNKQEQIATLCSCSRMTVFTVLKRFRTLELNYDDVKSMSEEEISSLLFPERAKAGEGYLIPDFKWEEFQMCKHQSSIRLCWRRYCKRAAKQNLMAYSWKCFITLVRTKDLLGTDPHKGNKKESAPLKARILFYLQSRLVRASAAARVRRGACSSP